MRDLMGNACRSVAGLGALALLATCSGIKYRDDITFLVAAQANSPEYPVFVNDKLCRDLDGLPGACTKRIRSTEALRFRADAMPYGYSVHVYCTRGTGVDFVQDVAAGHAFAYQLEPAAFASFLTFTCMGEVTPRDRDYPISAKWEARAVVVDAAYVARERAYITQDGKKSVLVLGEHARAGRVYDCEDGHGRWELVEKKTALAVHDPSCVRAFSESHNMRFNLIGSW